jgi:hypothetical protein
MSRETHASRPEAGFAGREANGATRRRALKEGARGGTMGSPTPLNAPRPALVETGPGGEPRIVNREAVMLVREEWRVVDRWWTDEPIDRRYFEVVLESGRNVCVYRDGERRCWFTQRA